MAERGIFGVSLWESLSPDLKRGVASDLARAEWKQKEKEKFRAVFPDKPWGCGTSYERPSSLLGFRQKRSSNA